MLTICSKSVVVVIGCVQDTFLVPPNKVTNPSAPVAVGSSPVHLSPGMLVLTFTHTLFSVALVSLLQMLLNSNNCPDPEFTRSKLNPTLSCALVDSWKPVICIGPPELNNGFGPVISQIPPARGDRRFRLIQILLNARVP